MPRSYAGYYELGADAPKAPSTLELRQGRDGVWRAEVHLPSGSGTAVRAAASAARKATAAAEAAALAERVLANPLVAAAMPPQAKIAVTALRRIAKAAGSKEARAVYKTLTGPGARRVFRALSKVF